VKGVKKLKEFDVTVIDGERPTEPKVVEKPNEKEEQMPLTFEENTVAKVECSLKNKNELYWRRIGKVKQK
jgi:hypothetical protein